MKLSRMRAVAPFCCAWALCGALLWGAGHGERWRRHVTGLGIDRAQARPEQEKRLRPAEYVAAQLEKAGVLPAGGAGYMQPVKIRSRRIVEQYSALYLRRGDTEKPLVLGEDAIVDMSFDPAPAAQAQLVFVGYGLTVPEMGYDDLAGLDLRGKIAVMLAGGPRDLPPSLRAHYESMEERNKALRRRAGVYGIVTIPNPEAGEEPWSHFAEPGLRTALSPADPAFEQDDDLELSIIANPDRADALFEGSGHTVRELLAMAKAGKPLPRFPLATSLRVQITVERQQSESQNIVGVLPGADPALKHEYVVLSGRLDDHRGADASMAAALLLDVADALHESGAKVSRSLLFAFLTDEDQRLLGSQFFTRYPPVDLRSIVADFDLEAPAPGGPGHATLVSGGRESQLGSLIDAAAARAGVRFREATQTGRFAEDSHYSFMLRGIPSAALFASIEQAQALGWRDASRIDDVALEVAKAVANRPKRPQWLSGSFFRQFGR